MNELRKKRKLRTPSTFQIPELCVLELLVFSRDKELCQGTWKGQLAVHPQKGLYFHHSCAKAVFKSSIWLGLLGPYLLPRIVSHCTHI